jgi:transcriptional regulator with XRE-family HTH domain
MKVKKQRTYSRYTREAAILLGQHIQAARKLKKFTESELAERAGVARRTLQKIEKGDLTIALGFAFEVATLLGIRLFEVDPASDRGGLRGELDRVSEKLALLPKRIRKPRRESVNDDF